MKSIPIYLLLLLPAAICHAQSKHADKNARTPEVVGTIDVINRTNDISKTSFKKERWYIVKFVNLNPLLFDLKTSSENRVDPVSKDDNVLQTLFNSLSKATGQNVTEPNAPAAEPKKMTAAEKKLSFKNDREETPDKTMDALNEAYAAFKQSVSQFKAAQSHIQAMVTFCNNVTGYCYDPLLPRDRIINCIDSNNIIKRFIANTDGVVNQPTLIGIAGRLAKEIDDAYDSCKNKLNVLNQAFNKLYEEDNITTSALKISRSADQSMAEIKMAYDKFDANDLTALASKTGEAYVIVHNPKSFDREARIYAGDVDSVITTMEIVALDKKTAVPGISPVKVGMNITGGFRTFTAIGLMVNFFNVRDDKYYIDADSTVRRSSRRNAAFPSLAMLQNFYVKNGRSAVWGGTIGLSANLNNLTSLTDLRIFLGPSCTLGNKVKLTISAGITGGYSEELKGDFEKDKKVSALMLNQEQNKLTDKYFRFGAYVGFAIKIL